MVFMLLRYAMFFYAFLVQFMNTIYCGIINLLSYWTWIIPY